MPNEGEGTEDMWRWINGQKKSYCLLMLMVLLNLTACVTSQPSTTIEHPAKPQTTLTISGSGGSALVLKVLADHYRAQRTDLGFEFLAGSSSGGGVKGVVAGQLDLGALSRPPTDAEKALGITYMPFATDCIAVVTSADLKIPTLTGSQVKQIFLGEITNWQAVGGPDAPINVIVRDEEETNTKLMRTQLFGQQPFVKGAVVLTSEPDLLVALGKATSAISYVSLAGLKIAKLALPTIPLDGHDPAKPQSGYPYTRPLGVAFLPTAATKVKPFLDFVLSPDAQALFPEIGLTPPAK
jgi:phosphate transport system substrate-binding protein